MAGKDYVPTIDASLGLVYRLNSLWNRADYAALEGNYDKWNNILDALYRNLLYRDEVLVEENSKGEVISVTLMKKDTKIYRHLSLKIAQAKKEFYGAKTRSVKFKSRSKWYHAVQMKDIWLRKLMQKLKLYLKENEKRPGSVMFGKFGGK